MNKRRFATKVPQLSTTELHALLTLALPGAVFYMEQAANADDEEKAEEYLQDLTHFSKKWLRVVAHLDQEQAETAWNEYMDDSLPLLQEGKVLFISHWYKARIEADEIEGPVEQPM